MALNFCCGAPKALTPYARRRIFGLLAEFVCRVFIVNNWGAFLIGVRCIF